MNSIIKKVITYLIAAAFVLQTAIIVPSMTVKTYADTDPAVTESTETGSSTTQGKNDEQNLDSGNMISDESDNTSLTEGMDAIVPEPVLQNPDNDEMAVTEGSETVLTADGESDDNPTRAPPQEGTKAASGTSVLTFTSDVHNRSGDAAATRLGNWIDTVYNAYGQINCMGFCGDMGNAGAGNSSNYWSLASVAFNTVDGKINDGKLLKACYTTGNHEYSPGGFTPTLNEYTQRFIIDGEGDEGANYRLYCLGSESGDGTGHYSKDQINALKDYLNNTVDNSKPIVIITHFPLHSYSFRTIGNAELLINALNDAANINHQKIIFIWGHNHSQGDPNYDQIFKPGDSITYASGSSATIQFYYAAAGCMSDSENSPSQNVLGKGLVLTIDSQNKLSFTYYNASGKDVTEGGTFTEQDPIAVTGVSIDTPSTTSVEVGKKLTLHATVAPSDATNKTVAWSSSDTSIATVDTNGKVTGIAEGQVTITATAGEEGTRALFTDSINIDVVPRSTEEQYFIIKINNYALSSNTSSEMQSNSSGYEYHGLQAKTYDANAPAPLDILWTLEEVEGIENGYYIKSYNGDYLSATYVRNGTSTNSGYKGTLTVGETQDIWIVNSGLDTWQEDGSYLKSTNASDNPRPADIYLTTRASNNSIDFFTVGSSSNYKISQLIEPDEIQQPVAVTGVTVDPGSMEITVGRSVAVTANVLPENADDKTVTWTSSDDSIATVDNSGRVKGIAQGEADITATTNDGGYTATCHVTVIPSSSPGIGYIIKIGDYAMSSNPSSDVLVNAGSGTQRYRYTGLDGVPYDENTEATEDILWLIEPTDGGYYIMSQDGLYLNATYMANETGGNTGTLKLDDTPDVWTFEGSLEDWVLSGSTLTSKNSGKSLTHEEGSDTAPLNLFTIRSTGESSSMIDPDNPAEVRFIETTALSNNKDYIVAVTASGNSVYAIENITGSSSGNTGTSTLDVVPASGSDPAYIVTDNTGVVWNYTSNRYLSNNGRYLSRPYSGTAVPYASGTGRAVTYDSGNKRLSVSYNGTYYLTNSSGTFGYTQTAGSAAQVRLFEKSTVFNFKYVVQFVSNGVNYQSTKYASGEVPVYTGATPTRAETEQYTYTFSGWSSDGFATVYGPDDALPAVTGPVTYVAQFKPHEKQHQHTFGEPVFNWVEIKDEGDVLTGYTCYTATFTCTDAECDHSEGYTFDEDVTLVHKTTTEPTCLQTGVETYTAVVTYNEQPYDEHKTVELPALGHDWGEPVYSWAADNSTVTATRVCGNDAAHEETETVNATSEITKEATCTEDGVRTYTSVAFENAAFEVQTKDVAIDATGHTPAEAVKENEVAPTCTEEGSYDSVVYCSVCEAELSRETVTVEALGHDFGEWTVTTPATCTEDGVETRYCSRCDAAETRPVEASGHDMIHHDAQEATCTEIGWDAYDTCSRCDYSTYEEIAALGHDLIHHDAQEATCTEIGWDAYDTCSRCDYSTYEEIAALGHDLIHHDAQEATCTAIGWDAYDTCSRCDYTTYEEIAALGHDWSEPTWIWNGYTKAEAKFICSRCNQTESVVATEEAITSEITKPATATENGEKTYTATVSFNNSTFTNSIVEVLPALGVTVSGNVKSFKTETDPVMIALYTEGAESAAYSVEVTGNYTTYSIAAVAPGTYTLKVSKKDHVTREYSLTVSAEGSQLDVEIWLLGDVNGSGDVTTIDAARANSHAQGKALLEGYPLQCGDVVGNDGTLTTIDAARINSHAQGKALLW